MNNKPLLVCLLALAVGAALLLPAPADSTVNVQNGVRAIWVGSKVAVLTGPRGRIYHSGPVRDSYLRCPCGKCTKSSVLALVAGEGPHVLAAQWHQRKADLVAEHPLARTGRPEHPLAWVAAEWLLHRLN